MSRSRFTANKTVPLLILVLLSACAGPASVHDIASAREVAPQDARYALKPDRSLIVFMRASAGLGRDAAVFDVTDGSPVFIAAIPRMSKFAHHAKPGTRRYMVVGLSNADFLTANLDPGKAYYSLVSPSWGDRFWFRAFRARGPYDKSNLQFDTPRFPGWYDQSKWVENVATPPESERVGAYMSSVRKMMNRWRPIWQQRPDKPALEPVDGQSNLYRVGR